MQRTRKPRTRRQTASDWLDSGRKFVLLESVGLAYGSPEHEMVLRQHASSERLKGNIEALRALGVKDFVRYRGFLYGKKPYDPSSEQGATIVRQRLLLDRMKGYFPRLSDEKLRVLWERSAPELDMNRVARFDELSLDEQIEMLKRAKQGNEEATLKLIDIFKPLLKAAAAHVVFIRRIPGITFRDALYYASVSFLGAIQRLKNPMGFLPYVKRTVKWDTIKQAQQESTGGLHPQEWEWGRKI